MEAFVAKWQTTERGLVPNFIKRERMGWTDPFLVVADAEGIVDELTFADIDNATNRAAWFLSQNLAQDEDKFYYMGRLDLRYYIWLFAAMKAGKCVVLPSTSNTVNANMLLFKDVGAKTVLHSSEDFQILEPLHAATKDSLRWLEIPKYQDFLSRETVEDFPFPYEFAEVKDKPCLALHTSGTTGHPKPIYWSHSIFSVLSTQLDRSLSAGEERNYEQIYPSQTVFAPFPFYHAGGMLIFISAILCGARQLIVPAPGMRLTAENITSVLQITRPDNAFMAPSLLENMLKYAPGLEVLSRIKHLTYGGGPINPAAGEKLIQVVPHLYNAIGSTEGSFYQLAKTDDNKHWNSFNFLDLGQRMEEVEPGLYELVFPRTDLIHRATLYFHSFPQLNEYRTKDLFSPVEGEPGWWTYRGRADNWIAMSNGLKFDPKTTEDIIGSHTDVSAVLVAGARRYRLCLLVELDDTSYPSTPFESAAAEEKWKGQILESIWPLIDEANHKAPKFGRIPQELVLFTARDKPFSRTAKGSIQRNISLAAYDKAIDELYSKSEQGLLTRDLPPLKSLSSEDLAPFVRELYAQTLEYEDLGLEDDVFSRGLDSFATASLSSRLKAGLRAYGVSEEQLREIGIKLLYTATTPQQMAAKLASMFSGAASTQKNTTVEMAAKYEAKVEELVKNFSQRNGTNGTESNGHSDGRVIAVTGTTGSLGTYILATLLARSDVSKVICLNRAADAKEKQTKAMSSRGLPDLQPAIEQGRVVFMRMDIGKPKLGLTDDEWAALVRETTSIVHNAFPVNFLMTVRQFEPQFQGTLDFLEVSLTGKRHPSFLFVSSISTAFVDGRDDVVPEVIFDRERGKDLFVDYGSAKFVCERMTQRFTVSCAEAGIPAAAGVLRVGQISGPIHGDGAWNIWEWLPSLVVSSKFLGVAPAELGSVVDWIPVDVLADIVSDLVDAVERYGSSPSTRLWNVVNPHTTTWDKLLPAVKRVAPETVSVDEWLARLEKTRESSTHILDQNPGVKLVEFYKGMLTGGGPKFSTNNLVSDSTAAANLGPVTQENMLSWMKVWGLLK